MEGNNDCAFTGNKHSGCAAFIHQTRRNPQFIACSNGLSRLARHCNTHAQQGRDS